MRENEASVETVREAAVRTGVSIHTIKTALQRGILPVVEMKVYGGGWKVRYLSSVDVNRWFEEHKKIVSMRSKGGK